MLNKKIKTLITIGFLATALVGCSNQKEEVKKEEVKKEETKALTVGLVTDFGGVYDNSFNQSAWEGLEKVKNEMGDKVEISYLESSKTENYKQNLDKMVGENHELVWNIGFLMAEDLKIAATEHPEQKFAIVDGFVDSKNVESVNFSEEQAGYLVGLVAGKVTKTNKVGFVGGIEEVPAIGKFKAGYVAGVKEVNPKAEVFVEHAGSFADTTKGKELAKGMYDKGADIIFHASGETGNGVFEEAIERFAKGQKVWVIGVDKDQSIAFGNDVTLTSAVKKVDEAVHKITTEALEGTFAGGENVVLGLKDDAVGLPKQNPNVPKDVLDLVKSYEEKIIKGDIEVPVK